MKYYITNDVTVGKRIAILFIVILISALLVMVYFIYQGRKSLLTDPYKSIPAEACIVIETIDLQDFLNSVSNGNGLFREVSNFREIESFSLKLKYLADQLSNPAYKKLLNSGVAIISLSPDEEGKIVPLLSINIGGEVRFRQIKEILRSTGLSDLYEYSLKGYPALKIPYENGSNTDTAFLSVVSGLLISSNSGKIIEESIDQIKSDKDVRDLPGFSKVLLASGKNEDKIFVVFSNLKKVINSILGDGNEDLAEKILNLAGTAEGDIYFSDNGLVLSGYTESINSTDYLFRYKSITPVAFQTYNILPSATILFETLVLPPDKPELKTGSPSSAMPGALAVRLKEYAGDEISRALIDIKENPVENNTLIIYELNNRGMAEQIFLEEIGNEKETFYFEPDDQVSIPVYKINLKGLAEAFLPGFAVGSNESYITFYDNFMISGASFITISRLLYDNILNKTLANDLTYRDFESTLPSRGGYFFYCVPSHILEYLSSYINKDLSKVLASNKNSLNKIQAAGYQAASSNDMIYNSISIRFKDEIREESRTEWETLLDTTAAIKPFFFTNHNTGAKEIFIQDMKNNTYLVNAAGRVLWKVPLRERITGSVYMIDYYKNGKYQLLFSGSNYIHILDRNGNYVERYPVKLRSPATNSLALFDYDNNLNYRLFIAGEDKIIYSYEKSGNVVRGWKPFKTSGLVYSEVSYFRVSGKDYIVISDDKSIYFLDRTGNKRVTLREAVSRAPGSSMRLNQGSESSVVCSSPDGTIQHIYFDGSIKKSKVKEFSVDHSFDFFDVDGDGFGEYIFIDKGILYLYDHNLSEVFIKEFGSKDLGGPINFVFSASDRKIGLFDVNGKLIYLVDKDGEIMNGFPLRGASMFSIGKLSDKSGWHLIVGGTDLFLYNYKIDSTVK